MIFSKKLVIFILLFSCQVKAYDINSIKWNVDSAKDNIIVFKADKKHPSGLIPIRVKTIINYSITRVVSVLTDASRKHEWVPNMLESKTILKIKRGEFVDYGRFDAPWPFDDRDFLVHIKSEFNKKDLSVKASIKSVENSNVPPKKGYVRGHTYMGRSSLKGIGLDKTSLEMIFLTDYKGNIPKWIINFVQGSWPRKFMAGLLKQLGKKDIINRYQHYLEKN